MTWRDTTRGIAARAVVVLLQRRVAMPRRPIAAAPTHRCDPPGLRRECDLVAQRGQRLELDAPDPLAGETQLVADLAQ